MGDAPHVASLYDSQHSYDSSGFLQQQQHNQQQQQQQQQYYALLQQQQQQIQQQQQHSMPQYHAATASSGQTDTDGQQQQQQQQYHHQRRDSMESNSGSATGNGSSSAAKSAKDKDKDQNADKDSGPHKFSRSKGACQQCRSVKQRCSGASKHPCERCQLYKLECIFSKEPPPPKDPQKVPVKKPSVKQASIDPENGAAVVHSLRAITERLRSIEDQIAAQNRQIAQASLAVRDSSNASSASADSPLVTGFDTDVKRHHHNGSSAPGSSDGPISGLSVDSSVTEFADPVSTVSSAIKSIDNMLYNSTAQSAAKGGNGASPSSPYGTNSTVNGAASDRGSSPRNGSSLHGAVAKDQKDRKAPQPSSESDVPDAITRGFVTVEEAQQLFDFYFQRCAQWTPPLEFHNDRNMYHVRRRSTFLFHSILAVSSYFCYVPAGENGLRKYYAIVTTLVESLAPMIVSPNPAELTVDLLMGLLICILWKPVRCGSQMQLGPSGFSQLQAQSKINPSSGYVLGGLALRISQLLSLSRRAAALSPNDKDSVNACRLWMWINLVDSQSALAEGKQPALDPSDALRSTRLFASFKSKPGDVRLAALVELHAAVVPIVAMHHGAQKTDFRALYRANSVLDRLVVYWSPLIEDAYRTGDPLAATFLNIFVPFVRLVLNADVFRTWLIRQKRQSKNGEIDLDNARHTLTNEEAHCIGFAVQAAEEMLYYLSTQSRFDGAARRHDWAPREPATGHRPGLNLDQDLARLLASSVDSILLVVFAFPPLFLAQLRASNLVNCDLDMAPEITNDLYSVGFPARSLLPASKFMRLMEVSAEFYEATAPNASFPSIQQASLLRSIACLSVPSDAPAPNSMPNGTLAPAVNGQQQGPGSFNMNQACAWNPTQASKVHQQYMQQIASQTAPTNPNLPYPYNQMVFSNEGAERLDSIMQNAVPDPTTSNSLLGSFAKIDADWNAYFSPAGLANNTANTYTFSDPGVQDLSNGSMPLNLYGAHSTYVQTPTGSVGVSPGATINTANLGGSKIPGQSPDSLSAFYQNTPSTYGQANSPIMPNTYSHMQPGNQSRLY